MHPSPAASPLSGTQPGSLPGSLATIAATLVAGAAFLLGCAGDVGESAADGDGGNVGFGGAQDIGQFRDIIERGERPAPETFDAGGFFAEHFVELPPPSCGKTLCVHPMVARGRDWFTRAPRTTLQLALTTPVDAATLPRLPLDLVIVVDRSGSMIEDGRLVKVKQGLNLLVDRLRPTDRLAIVSFHDIGKVDVSLTADRTLLRAAVNALAPGGGTNLYDGLERGLLLAQSQASTERQRRVLLLSDGLATVGNTDTNAIVSRAVSFVRQGLGVSTIGVGHSFDPTLMRTLAERGAGNFYFLEDAAAVDEVFTQELQTSMTPIALDLKLVVTAPSGVRITGASGRRDFTHTAQRGELQLPAAFAVTREGAPGEGRRGGGGAIFVDLSDTGLELPELASVELTYRLPGGLEEIQTTSVKPLGAPDDSSDIPAVSHQAMIKHAAMYEIYRGLRDTLERAEKQSHCTLPTLRQLDAVASAWNLAFDDEDIAGDLELAAQLAANLRIDGYPELAETSLTQCLETEQFGPIYPDYGYEDDYYDHQHGLACSTTGGAAPQALAPLGLALLGLVARRRRRAAS